MWKLPREVRLILAEMWGQPKFFEALGSQIEHMCASAREVLRELPRSYGDLPLAVITGAEAESWRLAADTDLAALSSRSRHVLAPASGHWVPLDAPQVVVETIHDMVRDCRRPVAQP